MNIQDTINKIKENISSNNEEQIITEQDVKEAYINIKYMILENIDDYFLFFASLNLLNAYVKKEVTKKHYSFKEYISKGMMSLIKHNPQNINFYYTKQLTLVEILGLQFSFHNAEITPMMLEEQSKYKEIKWSQIKLQPYAKEIFKLATSLDGLSNKSITNENIKVMYLNDQL